MNVIKLMFYPRYIKGVIIPFLLLVIVLILLFILSYSFVKIELDRLEEIERWDDCEED